MISGTRYQLQLETNRQIKLSTEIARGQAEISTGKRILAPSDDPVGAARIASIARGQADQVAWKANLNSAAALSANADNVLEAMKNAFGRASELMLRASNGTMSADNRNAIAVELQSIGEEIASLRDTRDSRGLPLFPTAANAIRIPVAADLDVSAVGTREAIFDNVTIPSGTSDLTSIIAAAVTAVQGGNPAAISASLDAVNAASTHIITRQGEQGTRGARIDNLLERNEGSKLDLAEERVGIEGADIQEIIARIQSQQLSLEAAQAVFARINKSTLFDLIS